jgi:hypothetical protein
MGEEWSPLSSIDTTHAQNQEQKHKRTNKQTHMQYMSNANIKDVLIVFFFYDAQTK